MISFLLASFFFTTPEPVEMPRAEGWLVREGGKVRLEDRYHTDELWYSQSVTGSWFDGDSRRSFTLASLNVLPPAVAGIETRRDYEDSKVKPDKRDDEQLRRGLSALLQSEIPENFVRPRQKLRGMKDVRYYEGTNLPAIVCAFLPVRSDHWSVAIWDLPEGDDCRAMKDRFEDEFWKELAELETGNEEREIGNGERKGKKAKPSERELLKRDAAHSVSAYKRWHVTAGEDFVILDDLRDARVFVNSLTNDLAVWRGRFAAALPTDVDTSDVLSVARIYRSRSDFLAAAGEDMQWAAAYWSPSRRELVAALPEDGDRAELRRTFRHEAFHQYLSYATAMIPVSPWLNEGYAQYFEDEGRDTFDLPLTEEQWDEMELALPRLLAMDYSQFYAGTDVQRRTNYRLAWTIAYFMEHGMREVRHDPFKNLKRDYFKALSETKDMREAVSRAFSSEESLRLFCNEWKRFWKVAH